MLETLTGRSRESVGTWFCGDTTLSNHQKGTYTLPLYLGINGVKLKTAPLITTVHIIFRPRKNFTMGGNSGFGLHHETHQT